MWVPIRSISGVKAALRQVAMAALRGDRPFRSTEVA